MKNKRLALLAIGVGLAIIGLVIWPSQAGTKVTGTQLTHYYSSSNGSPSYEGAVQVATGARQLFILYALNNSAGQIYLKVQDTSNSGTDNGACVFVLPIPANSFINVGTGITFKDFSKGIYVAPFTDAACSSSAGSIAFYSIDYQ